MATVNCLVTNILCSTEETSSHRNWNNMRVSKNDDDRISQNSTNCIICVSFMSLAQMVWE